jgi:hypothetical protein
VSWEVGIVEAVLYRYRFHDTGIHSRKDLVIARLAQGRVIKDLMKQGLLFDNTACGHAIAEIYHTPEIVSTPVPKLQKTNQELKALFFTGDFEALRAKNFRLGVDEYGFFRRWGLWLITWLPVAWVHAGYDLFVCLSCLKQRPQRRLFIREIRQQVI